MDRDSLAASNVADDVFAVKRITTTRARHHQVVNTTHHDRIVAQTNKTFNCAYTAPQPRFFLLIELFKLLWSKILGDDVSWYQLAVPNRSQQIIDASVTIITRDTFHVFVVVTE